MNAPAERPLFIAQDKLFQWESEGKVQLNGTLLTLVAEQRNYTLTEAVRFVKALGDEAPGASLVGKVRTKEQLKAMNAEHYMGSVILGDLGYEVQEGFVGMVALPPQKEVPASFAVAPVTSVAPRIELPKAAPAPVAAAPSRAPAPVTVPPPVLPVPAPAPAPAVPAAAPAAVLTAPSLAAGVAKAAGEKPEGRSDAELLADFLLGNLGG